MEQNKIPIFKWEMPKLKVGLSREIYSKVILFRLFALILALGMFFFVISWKSTLIILGTGIILVAIIFSISLSISSYKYEIYEEGIYTRQKNKISLIDKVLKKIRKLNPKILPWKNIIVLGYNDKLKIIELKIKDFDSLATKIANRIYILCPEEKYLIIKKLILKKIYYEKN